MPTQRFSPTDLGPDDMDHFEPGDDDRRDGNDPGDGRDGNGGGGDGPPTPPEPNNYHLGKKNKGGSGPPGGGDGGDNDPDKNEEDDDEKFRRRMIKFCVVLSTLRMMTIPKSRKLILLRSLLFLWLKPIASGESKRVRLW